MKKVKVMLLSLALLAVVGGALAFKAKFDQTFCYTYAFSINDAWTCTNLQQVVTDCYSTAITNIKVDDRPNVITSYCTTDPIALGGGQFTCKQQGVPALKCPVQTSTLSNE